MPDPQFRSEAPAPARPRRLGPVLDVVTTIAIVAAAAAIVWSVLRAPAAARLAQQARDRRVPPVPTLPLDLAGAARRGSPAARIGLVEFSEFQCPFCGKYAREVLPGILDKYVQSGRLLLVFRNLPLERLHPFAVRAASLAACADSTGRFWNVHDAFFAEPAIRTAEDVTGRAALAGLSAAEQESCLARPEFEQSVKADIALARVLQIDSTPAFMLGEVNGSKLVVRRVILGARSLSDFELAIDEALARVEKQ